MSEVELPWWKTDKTKAMDALRAETDRVSYNNFKEAGFTDSDRHLKPIEFAAYKRSHYIVEVGRSQQDLVFHFFGEFNVISSDFFRQALKASFEEAFKIEHRLDFFFNELARCMSDRDSEGRKRDGCGYRAQPAEAELNPRTETGFAPCPECGAPVALTFQAWTVVCHGFNNGYAEELAGKALDLLDKKFGA